MADFQIKIDSILGGIAPIMHGAAEDQFFMGVNIDPETSMYQSNVSLGSISPVPASQFSTDKLSATPMWIIPNGRDTNLYTYSNNGQITSYSADLTTETVISSSVSASQGNGAAYYNNRIYFATSADVFYYGPIDNTPAITLSAWTGNMAQQPLSAACNYPQARSETYPNHPMHVHVDNRLYFGDYVSASGKSCINWISSKMDGTLPGGSREVLDLPNGYIVTDIESFGTDLAILAAPLGKYTTGSYTRPGRSALFLWDTYSLLPYRQIDIPDALATAVFNFNGELRVWAGQVDGYVRLLGYTGGNSFAPLDYFHSGSPPFAGAVDSFGSMLAWGAYSSVVLPSQFCGVMTKGTRNPIINQQAKNVIISPHDTTTVTNPLVTCISFANTSLGLATRQHPLMGWRSDSTRGLDKFGGGGTGLDVNKTSFSTRVYNIGQEFEITKIRLVFGSPIISTTQLNINIIGDDNNVSVTPATITNSVYNGKYIVDLATTFKANNSFFIKLAWSNTDPINVTLPITVWGRTLRDN